MKIHACAVGYRIKELFDKLCDFLADSYREKMELGKIQHEVNPKLEEKFRYDNIAQQLEQFIQSI